MVIPAELQALTGNAVDIERWRAQAGESGFELVTVPQTTAALPADVDVIHAIHTTKGGVEAARMAGDRIPLILSICGSDFYIDYEQPSWRPIIEGLWRRADAIVLWHDGIRGEVAAIDPALAGKLRVIGPSVRLEDLRRATRDSWGVAAHQPLIVLPASIRAPKDPLFPVAALASLRRAFPGLRFLIAGATRDADYAVEVRSAIEQHEWIEFLGAVPRGELLGLMQAADVVLNTSPEEGFANSVLEAMRVGAPLLLRDNAGNRAAVRGAPAGPPAALFFASEEEFGSRMSELLGDPGLRARMGEAARRHADARFSEEAERIAYRDLYRSVAAAR